MKTERRTAKKLEEERIRQANQEWVGTFNSISDMIFILDKEHTITKANKAFLDTIKMKSEDVVGKKCYEIVHKRNSPWPNCPYQKSIVDGKAHTEQVDDPGLGLPLLISTSPILNEHGELSGTVHIAKDISEIVRTGNELKKVKEKLEKEAHGFKEANEGIKVLYKQLEDKNRELGELDQLKSDFVSVVSHELRTPLSITKEGISLVLDEITGKVNDKQKNVLNTSKDNIDRLAAIINDLLDISKIESGKVELKKSLIDISGLVREVCKEWVVQADKKEQELLFSLPKETVNIYIDRSKIIQVMNNLISNAIKYTPEKGEIKIDLKDEKNEIRVSVSDNGIGIAKEDLPKAFGKFQQFGRTVGAGPKGTGLGMAICKQIVQMHQGKIEIDSQVDKGTKLTFWLPKMESEKVFKEYINNGIRETIDRNNSMSLVMVTLEGFSSLQKKLGQEKAHGLLRCFEKAIEGCLRRKADTVVRDSGELVVLLLNTNKESVDLVKKRIEEAVRGCISKGKESWYNDLKITIGGATYPDEANSDDQLLKKSRGQE
ncbi:MAG: diguanylate cyclase [Candidatus Omnitrophica bacterium]|nr:diguanylate cyclase [Candidatus Omnitrophota bacterium]